MNTAATLWCAELCQDLKDGLKLARKAIQSGKALHVFEKWKSISQQ